MKLGTETGSLMNHVMAGAATPIPAVGMGCTILNWTDRDAATISAVETYRGMTMVKVREDHAKRTDTNGMSESQTYEYTPNPMGREQAFILKNGRWREMAWTGKRWNQTQGSSRGLLIGSRNHYHDFSF